MVFRKFFKVLRRILGFKKKRKRRATKRKRRAQGGRRHISRRKVRLYRSRIVTRKTKRPVKHKARRHKRTPARKAARPAKTRKRSMGSPRPVGHRGFSGTILKRTRPFASSKGAALGRGRLKSTWVEAGEISHYFPKVRAAVFRCRLPLAIGDAIWIKGKNTNFRQTVGSMQIDRKPIERAKSGEEIGLEVFHEAHAGDRLFLTRI